MCLFAYQVQNQSFDPLHINQDDFPQMIAFALMRRFLKDGIESLFVYKGFMKRHKKELIALYVILTTISTVLTITKNSNSWLVFLPFFIAGFGLFHIWSEGKNKD